MTGPVPAVTGTLEISYRVPMTREIRSFSLIPGASVEIIPSPGYVIDKITVSIPPAAHDA